MKGTPDSVQLLLARHPEVAANVEHIYVGRGDSPYTERGRAQVPSLAACVRAWRPVEVRTSPLRRTLEVARLVAVDSTRLTVDDDLIEVGFGDAEGKTYQEATGSGVPMDLLGGPADEAPFGGGETWGALHERVTRAAEAALGAGPRVAIITHGGVFRALLTLLLDLPHEAAWRFAIPPASVATVAVTEGVGALLGFGLAPGHTEWESSLWP